MIVMLGLIFFDRCNFVLSSIVENVLGELTKKNSFAEMIVLGSQKIESLDLALKNRHHMI